MKVAYILPAIARRSGWRTHAVAFINAMRTHVSPVLIAPASDLVVAGELFSDLPIFGLPATQDASLSNLRGALRLAATYRAIQNLPFPAVDLVHSLEAYPTGLVGNWLAEKISCPHVLTAHGTYGVVWHNFALDRRIYRRVLRQADLVCPGSKGTSQLMVQYFGSELGGERLHPVLNGNDYYLRVPNQLAEAHKFPGSPILLTVGEVKYRKGLHLSLAAFARVKAVLPQARYWIVGHYRQNQYFNRLQKMIETEGLDGVTFLGQVPGETLAECYQAASLFVMTPVQHELHFEGFGLVYLEAGAYGLPVVATRSGGVPDAVRDQETGLLASEGDVEGIADAILRLLGDPALSRRLGRANRRWAETLTWERNALEYYNLYQSVVAG